MLDRSQLPPAVSFYPSNVDKFRAIGRRRATGLCPFHKDTNPSFSMELHRGLFYCFSCGASGGSVLDFVMQRDGVDFKTAAQRLGAWRGEPLTDAARHKLADDKRQRERREAELAKKEYRDRRRRIELRNDIHLTASIQKEVALRLDALQNGAEPVVEDEAERCWTILAGCVDDLRRAESAYMMACGLEQAE